MCETYIRLCYGAKKRRRSWQFIIAIWAILIAQGKASTRFVTNLEDTGAGSFRSAVMAAQNGDVITFAVTGIITNTSAALSISNKITIVGPGADILTVSGNKYKQVFSIGAGATVSISGMTIRDGFAGTNTDGGGIYNAGNLTLMNCVITKCYSSYVQSGTAAGNGGAIYNSGTLTAVYCQFLNNATAGGRNGYPGYAKIPPADGGSGGNGGNGGAVYTSGVASFTNCTFGWNATGMGGYGGEGGGLSGPARRGGNGGNGGDGSAVFCNSAATFVSCTFFGNTNGIGGYGGAGGQAYLYGGASGSTGRMGGNGGSGAIYAFDSLQMVACTVVTNTAGQGGRGGDGGDGGDDYSTMGGNGGNGNDGGNGGDGGGVCSRNANLKPTLQNVLIAQNFAGKAGSFGWGGARRQWSLLWRTAWSSRGHWAYG